MALRQLTSRLTPRLLLSSQSAIAKPGSSRLLAVSSPTPAVAQAANAFTHHDGTKMMMARIQQWQPSFARGNASSAAQQQDPSSTPAEDQDLTALKAAAEALAPPDLEPPMTVPILNFQREEVGRIALPADIFQEDIRRDILQRVVRWQLAKRQQGTHSVKSRGMVRGGGRKPIPQKKTGNARAGSNRSPLWRGGGVIHGPVPRSHAHSLPKKVRRLGLKVALSAKASEGRLFILDSMAVEGKTKSMNQSLDEFLADAPRRSILFLDSGKEAPDGGAPLRRAISNLPWVDALPQEGANVYSILQRDYLAMTPGALYSLIARLRAPIRR